MDTTADDHARERLAGVAYRAYYQHRYGKGSVAWQQQTEFTKTRPDTQAAWHAVARAVVDAHGER